jgi:hypothetical protein
MGKRRFGGTGITLILAVIVLSLALGMGLAWYGSRLPLVGFLFGETRTQTTTTPVVVEGIQDLDRLSTVRWTESVVVTKEETAGNALRDFFTGEKIILIASGDVEAGIDLSEIGDDDVTVEEDRVSIDMPDPEILSSSLNEEETELYDRELGILKLQPEEDGLAEQARVEAEERMVETARENGILEYAEKGAEDSIRAFVLTLGFEKVEFE